MPSLAVRFNRLMAIESKVKPSNKMFKKHESLILAQSERWRHA